MHSICFEYQLTNFAVDQDQANSSALNIEDFSYKEVSELSEATDDIQAESIAEEDYNDLNDYEMLLQATQGRT